MEESEGKVDGESLTLKEWLLAAIVGIFMTAGLIYGTWFSGTLVWE